ncbi:MAG: serine protease [Rhodospirillales bacterium]|nr:serine protease [Rhodospirillales bacterium]
MSSFLNIRVLATGVFLSLSLAACQTIAVKVPEVKTHDPVEISNASSLATIKFDRVGVKVKRGTAIGTYEPNIFLSGCFGQGGNIFWNQGRVLARDIEFADLFYDEMKSANFNVVGNPDKMFAGVSDNRKQASYLIGGQIEDIKLNVCNEIDWWTGWPRGTQKGKGAVKVRWQVFSVLNRKIVFETKTEGAAKLETGAAGGELVIIQNAFANAVVNLAAKQEFVDVLKESTPNVLDIKNADVNTLETKRYHPRKQRITETIDQTRHSVVTIDSGLGHGSGFFISPTLIMTNFHVVENVQLIRINLLTGRKILGEVIRRHPKRDVAIIQVEESGHLPIPVRETPLKVTEEVYAIGSPLDKKLSGTVTRGIVSKFTTNRSGMEDIQADVDIQGGNSGGALLDANGNVVGVSYAGIGPPGKFSAGVNFFIPIMDALKKLNIVLKDQPKSS